MKRVFFLGLAFFGLFLGTRAHPVDQEMAMAIAGRFMKTSELKLSTCYPTTNNTPALYIFNTSDGFVIVAADDCETPIIGYSHEGQFDPNDVPVQMEDYLQDLITRIQYGIENHLEADEVTARQWELVKTTGCLNDGKNVKAVAPLITAKWQQGCLYNSLCPVIEGSACDHASVGCVAVAMGQIMHYWKFPNVGHGSHAYLSNAGGILSVDFGSANYHWDHMPNRLTDTSTEDEIEAVATLLYHCGVAVDMYYTPNGSGASSALAPDALVDYFKYSDEIHRETMNGDTTLWLNQLKECLDKGRPILYSGLGSAGHAFVCDGYDDNDMLHFNWGWGGNGDGYFAFGHLNPLGNNYNNSNSAILDIIPDYAPHMVTASAVPPQGGSIEGNGDYHCDQLCVLTAIPAEGYDFFYWKQNNNIVSYDSVYSLYAFNDVNDIEAIFSLKPTRWITAVAQGQDAVNLSWGNRDQRSWPVLKELDIQLVRGIATDGNSIYITKSGMPKSFYTYSMEGQLIGDFNWQLLHSPTDLTYHDGLVYCNDESSNIILGISPVQQCSEASIRIGNTPICSYDSVNDGLWIANYDGQYNAYRLKLYSLTGSLIKDGPILPSDIIPNGSGFLEDEDGIAHLIIKTAEGEVYDYNITQKWFKAQSLLSLGVSYGAYIGKYDGKDAFYVCFDDAVKIMEIEVKNTFFPIIHYRLYRSDNQGNVTMIADEVSGTSYTDQTWGNLETGLYRFGICSVYSDGAESKIAWSNPIPKGNYDIEENMDTSDPAVRKIFENGQIFIVKNGKRYTVTGQLCR